MVRVLSTVVLAMSVVCIGCSKSEPTAQSAPDSKGPTAVQPSPTEVVSQFLDLVRRGGENSDAGRLLTGKAQEALAAIGRTVQPIGSPDARFTVTRSEQVPNNQNAALVQSVWSEPNADGTESSYEVVWAVQKESAGWRISGLVMQMGEGDPPTPINFEDSALMAKVLAGQPEAQIADGTSQVANPTQTIQK